MDRNHEKVFRLALGPGGSVWEPPQSGWGSASAQAPEKQLSARGLVCLRDRPASRPHSGSNGPSQRWPPRPRAVKSSCLQVCPCASRGCL